jgi:multimeric flavodoxin WrbA
MPRLLVVHHSPTRALEALTEQVLAGTRDESIEGVDVVERRALDFVTGDADHRDLLEADGYVLGTTANFGYMSGALKHVFDSTFLQIGGALDPSGAAEESTG